MDTDMMLLALVCGSVWGLVRVTVSLMDRSAERELRALQFELDEIMAGRSGAEPARPQPARPPVAARRSAGAASRARLQGAF